MKEKSRKRVGERFPKPPQIFNDYQYWGDYEDFDQANEEGRLPSFLGILLENVSVSTTENPSAIRISEPQRIYLTELNFPVIQCQESFWNESFETVMEDPIIESIKNIEICLIQVSPVPCHEEKKVEISKFELNLQMKESISVKQILPSKPLRPILEESVGHIEKTKPRQSTEKYESVQNSIRKRSGPILNSVQLMLNAATLYSFNMNSA